MRYHQIRRCVTAHDIEPIQAALVVLTLAVGALSIATFKALDHSETAQKKLDYYQVLACERSNILRGYLLVRSSLIEDAGGSRNSAHKLFDIADCEDGGVVPKNARETNKFLENIAEKMGVVEEWNER